MGKDSFLIYTAFYKPISILSDKQLGRLFRAIFAYNLGEAVNVEDDIRMAFEFFKNQFDIDESKYQAKIMKCAEGGRKGGNPNFRKGQSNPYYSKNKGEKEDKPTLTKITSDNPTLSRINLNDNVNDNVSSDEDIKENTPNGVSKKAADAPFPTPTDIPFSDSENPESGLKTLEETPPPGSAPPPSPRIDYSAIMRDFNARFAGVLPAVTVMTEKRKAAVKARIGEHGMDSIAKVFDNIAASGFLKGHNDHNWKADFDWVFRPTNYVKILEGNYTKTGYGRKEQRQFGNTRPGDFAG